MKQTRTASLMTAGLLACCLLTGTLFRTPAAAVPSQQVVLQQQSLEQEAAGLINRHRISRGLEPLVYDPELSHLARIKSRDMAVNRYFHHNSPTYGSPFDMMKSLGLRYRSAGENIARGFDTPREVVEAWMNSESHRANILSDRYTRTGIGLVDGHWTQWFLR